MAENTFIIKQEMMFSLEFTGIFAHWPSLSYGQCSKCTDLREP